MGQNANSTAVLIFSLSAKREAQRKMLFGKSRKKISKSFFGRLITDTRKMASATGTDVVVIDEHSQKGRTFGERYTNAFQDLFDRGYSKVVSIGNDCPDLTAEILSAAIDRMQHNDLVVGPATDGGVYLLGLSQELFDAEAFLALPWLQESLFDALTHFEEWRNSAKHFLDPLSDIDNTVSLLKFALSTSDFILADFILSHLLVTSTFFIDRKTDIFSDIFSNYNVLRGPPSLQKAA